ncbi:MAG: hypothetical protein FJX75_15945 [Armatimonadetes bacterium]|nr:hypothetical protein [Armatimonadota bacterium]
MTRMTARTAFLAIGLLVLFACVAVAQEYTLQEYMPQAMGSKWTVQSTGGRGDETLTISITKTMDFGGTQVPLALTQAADGTPRSGSLELVSADTYTIYGMLFGGRPGGGGGGELTTVPYNPPVEFPGTLTIGQTVEKTTTMGAGDRQASVTIKLQLAAVENVTVPKGTFENCLKVLLTTTFAANAQGQTPPPRTRTIWYAKGVGAVKTERPGFGDRPATITELVDYTIGQ